MHLILSRLGCPINRPTPNPRNHVPEFQAKFGVPEEEPDGPLHATSRHLKQGIYLVRLQQLTEKPLHFYKGSLVWFQQLSGVTSGQANNLEGF